MSVFKRLFKIGQAEANAAIDKLEDPIKMTEQGIRDMKDELAKSLKGLAEIKALAIKAGNEAAANRDKATEYEHKAMLLLQNAQRGQMALTEAERLATEALIKRESHLKTAIREAQDEQRFAGSAEQLEGSIRQLKDRITHWEDELKNLRAKVKVSEATAQVNKQLANLDASGTEAMLDRMRQKVLEQEALAQSYVQIAESNKSIDVEIDNALESAARHQATLALEEMKSKLALPAPDEDNA